MRQLVLLLLATTFISRFQVAEASKCVVTKWRTWSECTGDCSFGQRVRNRDVVKPPFPEKDKNGESIIRECPPLYEVEYCSPEQCEENPFTKTDPEVLKELEKIVAPNDDVFDAPAAPLRPQRDFFRPLHPQKLPKAKASGIALYRNGHRSGECGINDRCCRIHRIICPNGKRPVKVTRWYRNHDEPFCRMYQYPYCGDEVEIAENPLYEEPTCQQVCFSDHEKTLLPALRIL